MDTNRIRYFLTLAKTGSVTKAAELHHISPAAFSKAMQVLASEFGVQISIPSGRGIALTDQALALVPELSGIIDKLDTLKQTDAKNYKKQETKKVLRMATFEVFSTYFFENAFGTQFKDHDCQLYEMIPGEMEQAVASGVADLALTYVPIPHPDLDFIRVTPITMGIYGNSRKKSEIEFKDLPFVVPLAPLVGSPNKVSGLDGWPDGAYPRNIRYRVGLLESALGLCRAGLAYAYIPKFVAKLHNGLVQPQFALHPVALPNDFKRQNDFVYLIKRKSDLEGYAIKKISQAIHRFCSDRN